MRLGTVGMVGRSSQGPDTHCCVQVLAALLHALPLKEDLEEWVTMGHLFNFLYQNSPDLVSCQSPPSQTHF